MNNNTELIMRAKQGDKEAGDRLVNENMGLVYSIVKRFTNRGYETEDIIQIGALGLIKAVKKFDCSFGVQFSTYAVPMITGEIKRFMRDDGAVKVSRSIKEIAIKGRRCREILISRFGREPTIKEIALECGESPEMIAEAFEAVTPPSSIYESVYDDGGKEIALIDKLEGECHEEEIINKVMLENAINSLEPRERQVIVMRYFQNKTQSEVAGKIGVSQVQVSRIEKKTLEKIRKGIDE